MAGIRANSDLGCCSRSLAVGYKSAPAVDGMGSDIRTYRYGQLQQIS